MKLPVFMRRIALGLDDHPGTQYMVFMTIICALGGAQRGGLGWLFGAGVWLIVFGPLYLWGAHNGGRDHARRCVMAYRSPGGNLGALAYWQELA